MIELRHGYSVYIGVEDKRRLIRGTIQPGGQGNRVRVNADMIEDGFVTNTIHRDRVYLSAVHNMIGFYPKVRWMVIKLEENLGTKVDVLLGSHDSWVEVLDSADRPDFRLFTFDGTPEGFSKAYLKWAKTCTQPKDWIPF